MNGESKYSQSWEHKTSHVRDGKKYVGLETDLKNVQTVRDIFL